VKCWQRFTIICIVLNPQKLQSKYKLKYLYYKNDDDNDNDIIIIITFWMFSVTSFKRI